MADQETKGRCVICGNPILIPPPKDDGYLTLSVCSEVCMWAMAKKLDETPKQRQ